ncbi:MAG: pimeloyl-ACP methyl ester carboxylesterase, partial [Granulosicoccus sp.]
MLATINLITGCATTSPPNGHETHRTCFESAGNTLCGTLMLPDTGSAPAPVTIFVHGDGPADADYFGYYRSIWNALANSGIASFSWDKPGVGDSGGNWLDQSMEDRAAETTAAALHLAQRPDIDAENIGVIGFSQAGWVLPRLANEEWLDYLVLGSTAIDWTDQGDYMMQRRWGTRAVSDPDGYQSAVERDQLFDDLMQNNDKTHDDYIELIRQTGGSDADVKTAMSPSRFDFARRNMNENAVQTLNNINVPVLGLFGTDDLNVDVMDSLSVYKSIFKKTPTVDFNYHIYPGATHALTKSWLYNK